MTGYWKDRKSDWFKGFYAIAHELVNEYYDWELDDMCDTFGKTRKPTGEYIVTIYRTYATDNAVRTSDTPFARAKRLTKEDVDKLWEEFPSVTMMTAKGLILDADARAEATLMVP